MLDTKTFDSLKHRPVSVIDIQWLPAAEFDPSHNSCTPFFANNQHCSLLIRADTTGPLKHHSEVCSISNGSSVVGIGVVFRGFHVPTCSFMGTDEASVRLLMNAVYDKVDGTFVVALSERQFKMCSLSCKVQCVDRVMELTPYKAKVDAKAKRLGLEHVSSLVSLYSLCNSQFWHPSMLEYGHYFGVFDGPELVSASGVDFVLDDYAQIANVATHPSYRRKGLARSCILTTISSVCSVAPKCGLFVNADDTVLSNWYSRLGFTTTGNFYFCEYGRN